MTQTVLLVGATGTLGSRIAHHLLNLPDVRLRLFVREALDRARREGLAPLMQRGAVEVLEISPTRRRCTAPPRASTS